MTDAGKKGGAKNTSTMVDDAPHFDFSPPRLKPQSLGSRPNVLPIIYTCYGEDHLVPDKPSQYVHLVAF